jgi:hypothetical protein
MAEASQKKIDIFRPLTIAPIAGSQDSASILTQKPKVKK